MCKVIARRCYESMTTSGINFGPAFQRLDNVRSDTTTMNATSEVVARKGNGVGYHMHPTVICASFQLLGVAASSIFADAVDKMMAPTNIEEICIYRCSENVQVRAFTSYTPNIPLVGGAQCVTADGNVVLHSA